MRQVKSILRIPALAFVPALLIAASVFGCGDVGDRSDRGVESDQTPAHEGTPPVTSSDVDASLDDLVGVLRDDGRFSGFVAALDSSQLAGTFEESGPFTFFAPIDGSYDADEIMSMRQSGAWQDFVMSHVVAGKLSSEQLQAAGTVETMYGRSLNFVRDGDGMLVGHVDISDPDIEANNGIVHAVDGVLWPEP